MRIVLASKSPRRKEILENLKIDFEIKVSNAEENSDKTDVSEYVMELSLQKAQNVKQSLMSENNYTEDTLIIGCDTVVSIKNEILGKPKDREDAIRMMKLLSGKSHNVVSGLTLIYGDKVLTKNEITTVYFDDISDSDIENYVDTGEPYDKAGGYAIQGIASKFVKGISGCYFNVVGLPTHLLYGMLKELGIDLY